MYQDIRVFIKFEAKYPLIQASNKPKELAHILQIFQILTVISQELLTRVS